MAGEAGIGKSRLTAEVRAHAETQGWQTVQGTCFERDVVLPYAPLIDLLAFAAAQHYFTQAVQRAHGSNSVYLRQIGNGLLALSYLHLHDLSKAEDALNVAGVDSSPEGLSGQLIRLIRAELALARGNAALALHLADRLSAALPNIQVVGARGVPGLALLRGKALAALNRPADGNLSFLRLPDLPDFPPAARGKTTVIPVAVYAGAPEAGEEITRSLRQLDEPLLDLSQTLPIQSCKPLTTPSYLPTSYNTTGNRSIWTP